jgi:putative superfamily III holin-X
MNLIPDAITDAMARLRNDIESSVRAELRTFKEELAAQAPPLLAAAAMGAVALVVGLAFAGVFTALCVIALSIAVAPWLAALIVTVIWGGVAAALASMAAVRFKAALPLKFDKTARNVKEDVAWIKSDLKLRK